MDPTTNVNKFLSAIDNKNTRKTYEQALDNFYTHSLSDGGFDLAAVRFFIAFCKISTWSKDTKRLYLSAVRSYNKFLQKSDDITIEVWFFIQEEINKYLSTLSPPEQYVFTLPKSEDVTKIIDYLFTPPPTKTTSAHSKRLLLINLRNRAIFLTLLSTGLRVSEVCNLVVADFDIDTGNINAVIKRNKKHAVTLSLLALSALVEYFDIRTDRLKNRNNSPLFSRHDRQVGKYKTAPLSPRSVQNLFRDIKESNNIEYEFTPHTIRRLFASSEFQKTGNFFKVRELLGHDAKYQVTENYIHQGLITTKSGPNSAP